MSYQEHGMWEILEVLRRLHRREKKRSIARVTGRSRETVSRYEKAARKLGWAPENGEPDETLAAAVSAKLRPGPRESRPSDSEKLLQGQRERLKGWIIPDNPNAALTLTKALMLLKREGVSVSYSALYRFAVEEFGFGASPATVRMADVAPGELAEVDFGKLGFILDPETGKQRVLYALIVVLVFSRHQYVFLTHSQKLKDLIDGLENAWEFFGGVPARVTIDNMKAAVTRADRYDPVFQRTFEEYARYRGFVIDAAVPASPKQKPHVERQVPYVRENLFRGEKFISLKQAQEVGIRWCQTTAGLRIHGTTRKQPLVQFESFEKSALIPLTKDRFDIPAWGEPKVHPDCHVRFNNALYSVPYAYRGKETTVRGDSKLVRIYVGGTLVKTHATQPAGKKSTDNADYPKEKSVYAMRDANYLIRKAGECGKNIGHFTEKLLSGTFPWAKLRQAQKLARLTEKYGNDRIDTACLRALNFDLINVHRVQRIVEMALENEKAPTRGASVIQLPLRFLRDSQTFNHNQKKEKPS
jgi:transposase